MYRVLSGSNVVPPFELTRISPALPIFVDTTGQPMAIASARIIGKPSYQILGNTSAVAVDKSSKIVFCGVNP